MRHLTFRGFLSVEVRRLAGIESSSVRKLCERLGDEPRLLEPLALWVVVSGALDRLLACPGARTCQAELLQLGALQGSGLLEDALAEPDPCLRPEYIKVWSSYTAKRDSTARDRKLKAAVREQVLELEQNKAVTRYRMAKDLGLNPGNLHAFLAQGNAQKVSLERAYELLRYLKAS